MPTVSLSQVQVADSFSLSLIRIELLLLLKLHGHRLVVMPLLILHPLSPNSPRAESAELCFPAFSPDIKD